VLVPSTLVKVQVDPRLKAAGNEITNSADVSRLCYGYTVKLTDVLDKITELAAAKVGYAIVPDLGVKVMPDVI
jgi:hypothetical protein